MKYLFLTLVIFVLTSFFSAKALAVVIQGNSSSTSTSTTTIEGSGSVTTHIKSTVNGITKTLDSNTPGTYTLESSSDDITPLPSSVQATPTITPTLSATLTAHPTHVSPTKTPHVLSLIGQLQTFFHSAIHKLLAAFHI